MNAEIRRLLRFCSFVLHIASWIVPRSKRADWLLEWQGEVWHWSDYLRESQRLSPNRKQQLLRHCWGSFRDALWLRFNRVSLLEWISSYPFSSSFCLIAILVVLSAFVMAGPMPLSWWMFSSSLPPQSNDVVTITLNWRSDWIAPESLRNAIEEWRRNGRFAAQLATYGWRQSVIWGPSATEDVLTARVTPSLFEIFGARPILGRTFESADLSSCASCVVLSNSIWRSQFQQQQDVIGKHLFLNGRQVEIIGVLPEQCHLPGLNIGLYLPFGPDSQPRLPNLEWPGAIIRLAGGIPVAKAKRELEMYVNQAEGGTSEAVLDLLTRKEIEYQSLKSCAVLIPPVLLLFVILRWWTVIRLSTTGPLTRACFLRWWSFFASKSFLLMLVVLVAFFDITQMTIHRFGTGTLEYPGVPMTWAYVVGLTVALSWSIRDQLSRCRVCLRRLRVRVDLGASVGTFGEPSGAELICEGGHGALHLPALQSGSVDSERWSDLDVAFQELAKAITVGA